MKIYKNIKAFQKPSKATVAIGIFDGVHLGHQQLLQQLHINAQEIGGEVVIVTFWPPPKLVLAPPDTAPTQLLTTFEEKAAILSHLDIDHLLKIRFTKTFSRLSAKAFVQQVLVAQVGMTQLIVGHGHRFGKDRKGDITLLQEAGLRNNFRVKEVAPALIDNVTICSTKIRQLLLEGNIERAQAYLGRPYEINCSILQQAPNSKHGLNLNLAPTSPHKLIPADGLYTIQVIHQDSTDEGILRITRKYAVPTIELAIPNRSSTTWHSPSLCIRFKR